MKRITKQQLEKALDGPVRVGEWQDLVDDGYLDDRNMTPDRLAAVVRIKRARWGRIREGEHDPPQDSQEIAYIEPSRNYSLRQKVLSELIALEAVHHPTLGVWAFRGDVLHNKLLKLEEVEQWIEQQAKLEGSDGKISDLELPTPQEYEALATREAFIIYPLLPDAGYQANQRTSFPVPVLQYVLPGETRPHKLRVSSHKTLYWLSETSKALARVYHWLEPEATVFMLTGVAPLFHSMTPHIIMSSPRAVSRINLSIDPTLTPQEVAREYARIREMISGKRPRTLSEKHLRLALFAATEGIKLAVDRQPGRTRYDLVSNGKGWDKHMEAWNRQYPDPAYVYTYHRNFKRDCKSALQRLLHPDYSFNHGMKPNLDKESE